MSGPLFGVREVDWASAGSALAGIRRAVFVLEQGVAESLEWDGLDAAARHWLARDRQGLPIGCVRLLDTGQIGRMAVLRQWRRRGVGQALLAAVLDRSRGSAVAAPFLNAQLAAIEFYRRVGFVAVAEPFTEAGILHRRMVYRPPPAAGFD